MSENTTVTVPSTPLLFNPVNSYSKGETKGAGITCGIPPRLEDIVTEPVSGGLLKSISPVKSNPLPQHAPGTVVIAVISQGVIVEQSISPLPDPP